MRTYSYSLGFKVNGTPIPDPTEFKYQVADLDVSAERTTSGLLIRDRVATKHNVTLTYTNINWTMIETILGLMTSAKFKFTFPRPGTNSLYTGDYYVGNRDCDAVWLPHGAMHSWLGNLGFTVIEY